MSVIDGLNKILGDPNEKELRRLRPIIKKVRDFQSSDEFQKLKLEDLPGKTEEFKQRLEAGETLDDIMYEAFALVCRACELLVGHEYKILGQQELTWDMVPYDVQLIGGLALHQGSIAEMKTGEGKTLVSTMPVYLNALAGKGVHIITVNDYLAKRDAEWMGPLYEALGISLGVIVHEKNTEERREAYASDVTFGTNNEFGFDYLRDNMAPAISSQVQRGLNYAIVDEVDSILIDEARTPLIISQPGDESTDKYVEYSKLVSNLQDNKHYIRDEKQKVATLTEEGITEMEKLLNVDNIYTEKGFDSVHHIEQALRAAAIYQRDVDYVVKDGEIIIVDEFTGRLMPGRRYSHGLHQALEAKENVTIQRESKTLATITFQNYFRLYNKLAGMTGTAKTEEEEFESIYKVKTIVIPTNRDVVRDDKADIGYKTVIAKFKAIAKLVAEKHELGQPVLVGTTSIEKSEALAALLEKQGTPHHVLNAKKHQQEAEIVANAGQKGAVTIATNMAGRGTDIKLGEGVAELGGLCIIGSERHESRRIDNQLRGRSGRQGDPGESQFFVSMEDDLMRLFGGDRVKNLMNRFKLDDDVPLEFGISRSIEGAQKRVEGRNFDIRKHVVQYDNVLNKHREIMYSRRQNVLERIAAAQENGAEDAADNPLHDDVMLFLEREGQAIANTHAVGDDSESWEAGKINDSLTALHPQLKQDEAKLLSFGGNQNELGEYLVQLLRAFYGTKCQEFEAEAVAQAERVVTLQSIDTHWMDHIDDMSHLREQVAFSGYAQRNPLIEYQDQGYRKFEQLLRTIETAIVRMLLQIDFKQFAPAAYVQQVEADQSNLQTNEDQIEAELIDTGLALERNRLQAEHQENPIVMQAPPPSEPGQQPDQVPKVGRNDPCPCGSGKKYKKCHGA